MSYFSDLKNILDGLDTHPLTKNSKYRITVMKRILWWQILKFRYKLGLQICWINDCKLMVYPGRACSTGNFYYGLLEYEPMAFTYHYISDEDVFFDIGANIGVYSILGKKAKQIVAFEPALDTSNILQENFNINNITNGEIIRRGVSDKCDKVFFTKGRDSVNHIIDAKVNGIDGMDDDVSCIEVIGLDSYIEKSQAHPTIMKIDTEGTEEKIIIGGKAALSDKRLNVIIMEIFENNELVKLLQTYGFSLYTYDPMGKILKEGNVKFSGDTGIFIRDEKRARAKILQGEKMVYDGKVITA